MTQAKKAEVFVREGGGEPAASEPMLKWKIHPTIPVLMILNFLGGLAVFFGHHLYYSSLHNQPATSQENVYRVGLVLAFSFKTFMGLCIGLSYIQCVWLLLRSSKAHSIEEIDSLFDATSKALSLLSLLSMSPRAALVTVIAFAFWIFPLASIFPPSALTVRDGFQAETRKLLVPAIDIDFEESTSTWYGLLSQDSWVPGNDAEDYYIFDPILTNDADIITHRVAFGGDIMAIPPPIDPEVAQNFLDNANFTYRASISNTNVFREGIPSIYGDLPAGSRLSYRTSVTGPLFKCSHSVKIPVDLEAARAIYESYHENFLIDYDEDWRYVLNPFCTGTNSCAYAAPLYNCSYTRNELRADYGHLSISYFADEDFDKIREDGELAFNETNVFECFLYNATIPLEISSSLAQPVRLYDEVTFNGNPVVFNTTAASGFMPENFDYHFFGNDGPTWHKEFIGYDKMIKNALAGSIRYSRDGTSRCIYNTKILSTNIGQSYITDLTTDTLADATAWLTGTNTCGLFKAPNVEQGFESLSLNLTISLLSNQIPNGLNFQTQVLQDVAVEYSGLVYEYRIHQLAIAYGIGSAAAGLILLAGLAAIFINGISMSAGFATFLAVTRDPSMDAIANAANLNGGSHALPNSFLKAKISYGLSGAEVVEKAGGGKQTSQSFVYADHIGFTTEARRLRKGMEVRRRKPIQYPDRPSVEVENGVSPKHDVRAVTW